MDTTLSSRVPGTVVPYVIYLASVLDSSSFPHLFPLSCGVDVSYEVMRRLHLARS